MVSSNNNPREKDFYMHTARSRKRQDGTPVVLEYWSVGVMGSVPNTPLLHHSNTPFLFSSLPRMKLPVHFFKPRAIDVRINLRSGNIGVAEHRLHGSQIGAAFEQMGRERMTQGVRRHSLSNARGQGVAPNEFPETLAGHAFSRAI